MNKITIGFILLLGIIGLFFSFQLNRSKNLKANKTIVKTVQPNEAAVNQDCEQILISKNTVRLSLSGREHPISDTVFIETRDKNFEFVEDKYSISFYTELNLFNDIDCVDIKIEDKKIIFTALKPGSCMVCVSSNKTFDDEKVYKIFVEVCY